MISNSWENVKKIILLDATITKTESISKKSKWRINIPYSYNRKKRAYPSRANEEYIDHIPISVTERASTSKTNEKYIDHIPITDTERASISRASEGYIDIIPITKESGNRYLHVKQCHPPQKICLNLI